MGILTDEMKHLVQHVHFCYVATVCPDGSPNLSPKRHVAVWDDDHLAFADIRSPRTITNLQLNPVTEINVVDTTWQKGFRFKGTATVLTKGPRFVKGIVFFRGEGVFDAPHRIKSIVLVKVERALRLTRPSII